MFLKNIYYSSHHCKGLDAGSRYSEWVTQYERFGAPPTNGFAGLGGRVDLVSFLALTLVAADLIDARLATNVWVGTLVNICTDTVRRKKISRGHGYISLTEIQCQGTLLQ